MVPTLSSPNNSARVLVSTSCVARYSVKMSTFTSGVLARRSLSPLANPSSFESGPGNASRRARSSSTSFASPRIRLAPFAVAPPTPLAAFSSSTSAFPPSSLLCFPCSTSTRCLERRLQGLARRRGELPKGGHQEAHRRLSLACRACRPRRSRASGSSSLSGERDLGFRGLEREDRRASRCRRRSSCPSRPSRGAFGSG